MKQYHMKLIRLSEICSRISNDYTFLYLLILAQDYSQSDDYAFIYHLLSLETIS